MPILMTTHLIVGSNETHQKLGDKELSVSKICNLNKIVIILFLYQYDLFCSYLWH